MVDSDDGIPLLDRFQERAKCYRVISIGLAYGTFDDAGLAPDTFDIFLVHVGRDEILEFHDTLSTKNEVAFGGDVVFDGSLDFRVVDMALFLEFVPPHGADLLIATPVTERVDVGLELLFLDEADSVDEEIVDAGEIFGGTG